MDKIISNIVFTKNRPLQLHAYLESLYRYFPAELIQTYIIYKVELFGDEYESLFQKYHDCVVVKEHDFHSDFLSILNDVTTKYILFGVDDVVFFDSVDFSVIDRTFNEHPQDIFGFSLRFGSDAEFMENGTDNVTDITIEGQTVHRLNWKTGQAPHTRYPFELCSTIYSTDLVKKVVSGTIDNNSIIRTLFSPNSILIKALSNVISTRSVLKSFGFFFSPNTLESWNCRWCQRHAEQLAEHLYFQKLCASAIQVNMVNTSTNNKANGTEQHTVEALNEKYRQGYRLDIDSVVNNKPKQTHCDSEFFKLVKCDT